MENFFIDGLVMYGAWSVGGNLNVSRYITGCGTQTAGLGFGGYTSTYSAITEEYDGTSWSYGETLIRHD